MSRRKNQHVVPHQGKWAVKGFGNKKNTAVTKFKKDAIRIAKKIAINQKTELFIHKRNGVIEERNSYGKDVFPPEG
jgi:hypothetical protein